MAGKSAAKKRAAARLFHRVWRDVSRSSNPVYFLIQIVITMAGALLITFKGPFWVAVGTGMMSTGIAGLITFFYVLVQEGERERQRALERSGMRSIFPMRSISIRSEYENRLRDARDQIDILGFGLNSLREDFGGSFERWALQCRVRILLLDPDAPSEGESYANARDLEEGDTVGKIRAEVENFLNQTASLRAGSAAFQVRLYRTMPSVNIFRIDRAMFFGPYLLRQPSRNTPTMLVGDGFVFDRLADHFEQVWSDDFSRPAP